MFSKVLSLCSILVLSGTLHAEIYQWTDDEGTTHFSDKPINSEAKKVDFITTPVHKNPKPKVSGDNDPNSVPPANKDVSTSHAELTEELAKARKIREAERKKRKQDLEDRIIKCQDETTKLALMQNELQQLDEKLKTISRNDREKSVVYIKQSDLQFRLKRQKIISQNLCG